MPNWKEFELNCTKYLNDNFSKYAFFIHEGAEDSTKPDIKVITKTNDIFYIEAKLCPAQCGQFVLVPDIQSSTFTYSPQNDDPINIYSKTIQSHMNKSFEEYKEAGTTGKEIYFDNDTDIFCKWIFEHYKRKNVRFIITNNFKILRLEDFANHFIPSGTYRVKRSGSGDVGAKRIPKIKNYISSNYDVINMRDDGSKLFATSDNEYHNSRFYYEIYEYMFSKRISEYEIRKLSNTFNANVIFNITEISESEGLSSEEFISLLR